MRKGCNDDGGQGLPVGQQPGGAAAQGVSLRRARGGNFCRGDEVVLRARREGMLRALDLIRALPEDVVADRRDDSPEEREPW